MTTTTEPVSAPPVERGPARLLAAARAPGPARLWAAALVAVPTVVLFVLGYRRRWICDDGMIYLRPVRQIVAGNGPVFNIGERAESSTGAVWQWLLALCTWVTGTDPAFLAVGLGLLLSTAGFAFALVATCRLHGGARAVRSGRGVLLMPAGVLVLLAVPPFWSYMTSGLECGLGTFWCGFSWWLLVRTRIGQSSRATVLTAFVFGLGWLVRPDLTVATVCFLAAQWWVLRPSRPSRARVAGLIGVALAVPVAYEVFRAGYYGVLLPLPAIAKEASASDWGRGAEYVQETLGPYWMWPALAVIAVVTGQLLRRMWRRRAGERTGAGMAAGMAAGTGAAAAATTGAGPGQQPVEVTQQQDDPARPSFVVLLAPAAAGLLLAAYVMRVGGDYMHARMILPALVLLLFPVLLVPATRLTAAAAGLLLVWLAAAVSPLRHPFDLRDSDMTFNVRSSDITYMHDHNPVRSATWVKNWPRLPKASAMLAKAERAKGPTLLYFDHKRQLHAAPMRAGSPYHVVMVGRHLGATGAAVRLDDYVNDAWGLASPVGAHLALERWSWPGHEKFLRNHWIFAEWAVARPSAADLRRAGTTAVKVNAARAALDCGQLAELRRSVREPLTPERFWKNLTGSFERTRFRFPRGPGAAERYLCG